MSAALAGAMSMSSEACVFLEALFAGARAADKKWRGQA
jgi:hypothetical protein